MKNKKKLVQAAKVAITRNAKNKLAKVSPKVSPPPFPRLVNPNPEQSKALTAAFSPYFDCFYSAPKLNGYLAQAVATFFNNTTVHHIAQSAGFVSAKDKKAEKIYMESASNFAKESGNNGSFLPKIKVLEKTVILYTKPVEMSFIMTIPGPQATEQYTDLTNYMKKLFPGFQVPRKWTYSRMALGGEPINLDLGDEKITTGWVNLNKFDDILHNDEMHNYLGHVPEKLNFAGQDEDLERAPFMSLFGLVGIPKITSFDVSGFGASESTPQGMIANTVNVTASVECHVQIRLPLEMALWMTHTTRPTDFNPKAFWDFCNEHMSSKNGFSRNKPETRTMTMKTIQRLNEIRKEKFGVVDTPRVNAEGYIISARGEINYIPTVNNVAGYTAMQKGSYNPETNELTPDHKIPGMINYPVLSDWMSDVYAYTGADGKLQTESLGGCIALDDVTIGKLLLTKPIDLWGIQNTNDLEHESHAADKMKAVFELMDKLVIAARSSGIEVIDPVPGFNFQPSIFTMWSYISGLDDDVADIFSGKDKDMPERTKNIVAAFAKTLGNLDRNIDKLNTYAVSTLMSVRFWLTFFSKYAMDSKKYTTAFIDSRNRNAQEIVADLPKSVPIPNIDKKYSVLPHQLQGVKQTQKAPEFMVLAYEPGGDKTFAVTIDLLQLKQMGKVKTALVICPPGLVKEWCSELIKFGQGKINALPITGPVIKKMRANLNMDRQAYVDYLKKAPANTVFVTSMNFLKLKSDLFSDTTGQKYIVRYGSSVIIQYPNIWLLRQLAPDYIAIDESQWAKNLKSQTTVVVKQISSYAKYRRLATGTIIKNRGDDLIGQMSVLNPHIYGDTRKFYDKYCITGGRNGDKFEGFKEGIEPRILQAQKPYNTWLSKNRADWSFLLPKINTRFYNVTLTDNQQKFYDDLMSQATEEIRKDKKLQKMLDEGDPDLEDMIEERLKLYLIKMEIFVSAPDDTEKTDFANLSYVEPKDLISPKVRFCERLVECHFEGGEIEDQKFIKQTTKVIIFGYNKKVIEHFRRHFKPKYSTVFYQAGDDEAITRFRNDPSVKILVAAENSLKEGLNLQVASRLVRLQTLWSPGDQEQAVSRVMRPDVSNTYSREEINYDWLVTDGTIEVAKTCRLISKVVSNMKIKKSDDPGYLAHAKSSGIQELPLIKMSMETIQDVSRFTDLPEYTNAWGSILNYEAQEFYQKKETLRAMVARKMGVPVTQVTDNDIKTNSFSPIEPSTLAGSRSYWTPLQNGAVPLDVFKLDLKPVAALTQKVDKIDALEDKEKAADDDSDDDDADFDMENGETLNPGDLVQCEYGIGFAKTVMKKQVKVEIPGFPYSPVTIHKAALFKPTNEENIKKVMRLMKLAGKKGLTFMNGIDVLPKIDDLSIKKVVTPTQPVNKPSTRIVAPTVKVTPQTVPKILPKEDEEVTRRISNNRDKIPSSDKKYPIQVGAGIFDAQPMIYLWTDQDHLEKVHKAFGNLPFSSYPAFVYRHIKTFQGLKNLIEKLNDTFEMDSQAETRLMNAGKKLYRKGNPQLVQRQPIDINFKTFLSVTLHKTSNNPNLIKLYPMLIDGQLYVAGAISNQPKQINKFKRLSVSGVGPYNTHEPMNLIRLDKPATAMKLLSKMNEKFKVVGIRDAMNAMRAVTPAMLKP